MRQFSPSYLEKTREGMWADSLEALRHCALDTRELVLDVGAGTGALTTVLREEVPGTTVALDADRTLLEHMAAPRVVGDALRLPFPADTFDLVVCQALLVNLPEPKPAVREFARVSSDLVAVVEPDNSQVSRWSTVDAETPLARRARACYLDSTAHDAALGAATELFERVGLQDVRLTRYEHEKTVEPPYSDRALEAAKRMASGASIEDARDTLLAGETTPEEFEDLRQEWRAMGRSVIEQMGAGTYRKREVVPFFITVGTTN